MSPNSQIACNLALAVFVLLGGIWAISKIPAPVVQPVGYAIQIIDGCEYLRFFSANNYEAITHKGNCKNHETR